MLRRIATWLFGSSQSQPVPTPQERRHDRQRLLDAARARRASACDAADAALERNDARDYGRALMIARQATSDVLKLEMGR